MTEIFPNPHYWQNYDTDYDLSLLIWEFTNWTTTSISTPVWSIPAIDTYYFDVYDVDFDDSEEWFNGTSWTEL